VSAEILSEWNRQVLEFAEAEDGLLTLKGVRTLAMMHISMHDALSAIERRNLPYIYDVSAPDADPLAATVQAAFTVVSDQYPDLFGAGWATVRPFALTSPDQFRSPLPPDIASARYTEAFNEVKAVGRYESNSRSADQTHLAFWWKDFAENSHNRLARELVAKERGSTWAFIFATTRSKATGSARASDNTCAIISCDPRAIGCSEKRLADRKVRRNLVSTRFSTPTDTK